MDKQTKQSYTPKEAVAARNLSLMRHHAQAAIDALHGCDDANAEKAYVYLRNAAWNIERGLDALKQEGKDKP